MLQAISDYVARLLKSWVAWMSGAIGLLLIVLDWWADLPGQKQYFLIASVLCIVTSSFSVWFAERKERLRLERESGPNLLMKLVRPQSALEIIQLLSEGTETAINVQLEESENMRIKVTAVPWSVPFVRAKEKEDLRVHFFEQVAPNFTRGMALQDFLGNDLEQMKLAVRFENAAGTKFRRRFVLRRELLHGGVHCYPERREIVREED